MTTPVPRRAAPLVAPVRSTPVEVRRTRRWMLLLLLTPVLLIIVAVLVVATSTFKEPVVPPVSVPAGYRAITDAYYGYAVPADYAENASWTDADGDFFYGTASHGWVAETMLVTRHAPGPAMAPPRSFLIFGESRPEPYRVSGGHTVRIPNATVAYEVDISRPGGWHAVAVDTWLGDSSTQMWLLVKASPSVTSDVIASLRGS